MNVGDKLLRFSGPIWWAFCTISMLVLFNQSFTDLLSDSEQRVVAITLFALLGFQAAQFTGKSIVDAQDSIKETEAREDGLATEYPGYGYLRSAHREIFT